MNKRFLTSVLLSIILIFGFVLGDVSEKEKTAIAAAEEWLKLVDKGKYEDSWMKASEFFKEAVTQEQWVLTLQQLRDPLGKMSSRKIKTKSYATSLPNAPEGEYVVIQFEASFENLTSAIETVTSMLDKDGKWRVSGYYIKAM